MSRMVYTTVYLTAEQHGRVKRLSETTKIQFAVYVREAIDLVLAQHREALEKAAAQ